MAISAEETEYVATIAAFVDREVRPVVRDLERSNTFPAELIERMRSLGVFALCVPEEYGGSPVSTSCFVSVAAELARGWMSLAGAMGPHSVVCTLLTAYGTPEQRSHYLPRLATGEIRGAKKIPKLMLCTARYLDEPQPGRIPHVRIELPDGEAMTTDDPAKQQAMHDTYVANVKARTDAWARWKGLLSGGK